MKTTTQKQGTSPKLLANGQHGEPTHDEIALRAYSLWENQGHAQNQELANWLQAEVQLRQTLNQDGVRA